MTPPTIQTLRVKGTTDQLPDGDTGRTKGQSSPLWEAVANECRQNPGAWVMFEIPGRNDKSLQSAVQYIKIGKLVAFKQGSWTAAKRGTVLYVKYLGEAAAEVVSIKNREVA